MVIVTSFAVAVVMCIITMLCWGSWANTQKLASKEWRFQLFYWDYSLGVLLFAVGFALTLGSLGPHGRPFLEDLAQADGSALALALLAGVVFNFANLLLVAAIDVAGLAVAFPVGIGLALVIGVIVNYVKKPEGNLALLALGVAGIAVAVIVNAIAYRRLPSQGKKVTGLGIGLSIAAGIPMGLFFYLVIAAMSPDFEKIPAGQAVLVAGKLGPYAALVLFAIGLFASSFLWNTIVMKRPFVGDPIPLGDYFRKGNARLHLIGILGGVIWNIGMCFNIVASGPATPAISYGLGQGATLVAALWGVFVWKEFRTAPPGTSRLLSIMFASYVVGLVLLIVARNA